MTAPQGAAPKKSLSVSRVILLLILVAALGALGWDLYNRHRMGQLDESLKALVDQVENSSLQGLSKQKVHSEIGEPTRTSSSKDSEEYDFPGVFYIHRVKVKYRPAIEAYDGHKAQSVFRIGGE